MKYIVKTYLLTYLLIYCWFHIKWYIVKHWREISPKPHIENFSNFVMGHDLLKNWKRDGKNWIIISSKTDHRTLNFVMKMYVSSIIHT